MGEKVNILQEIQSYKSGFIRKYFERQTQGMSKPAVSKDTLNVRYHFAAFSAAHQTLMLMEKGGFQRILNCIEGEVEGENPFSSQEDYYLQSEQNLDQVTSLNT